MSKRCYRAFLSVSQLMLYSSQAFHKYLIGWASACSETSSAINLSSKVRLVWILVLQNECHEQNLLMCGKRQSNLTNWREEVFEAFF